MPITDIQDANIQDQIDAYVRGKLSPDEEIQFEGKYLDDIEVVKEIERLYALKQGLAFADINKSGSKSRVRDVIHYLSVPQTAWGAIAATLLLLPVGVVLERNISTVPVSQLNMYLIAENNIRGSADTAGSEIHLKIPKNQKELALGFVVPQFSDETETWNLEILNASKEIIWRKEHLKPTSPSSVYIRMTQEFLLEGRYTYRLIANERKDLLVEGELDVTYQ